MVKMLLTDVKYLPLTLGMLLPAWLRANAGGDNPALQPFLPDSSRSELRAGMTDIAAAGALPVEEGTGHLLGSVSATSYQRLGRSTSTAGDAGVAPTSTTVSGSASFSFGKIRDIRWNNSADFDLVGPYVLGDSVGGDLQRKSYRFSGMYAGVRGSWSWGADGSYRATIDYRDRDPRDRIIVSDLHIGAGGSYLFSAIGYRLGANVRMRVYNQTADLTFYNPMNDIRTYALTGLGSIYPRFSGNSSQNTAYSGIGWTGGMQFLPAEEKRWNFSGEIHAAGIRISQVLRDFNNLTLTSTSNLNLGARFGIIRNLKDFSGGLRISGEYRTKNGTENLFGASSGNNYEVIGKRDNYSRTDWRITLELPLEWEIAAVNRLSFVPAAGMAGRSEKLHSPARRLASEATVYSLTGNWKRRLGRRSSMEIGLTGLYRSARETERNLAGLNPASDLTDCLLRNFGLQTSDVTGLSADASVEFPVGKGMSLSVEGNYRYRRYRSPGTSYNSFCLSAGLKF